MSKSYGNTIPIFDSGKKISIRPECLRITSDRDNDRNSFQVAIKDVVFQGKSIKLIANYNEQEIIASVSPLEHKLESSNGDKITADADNLMIKQFNVGR